MKRIIAGIGYYAVIGLAFLVSVVSTSTIALGQFVVENIADQSTSIPGSDENFTWFHGLVSLGNGDIAFVGSAGPSFGGVYAYVDGILEKIADTNTPIPDGTGNFVSFEQLTPAGNEGVIFLGSGAENRQQGIYRGNEGTLTRIADMNTPIPGGTANFGDGVNPFETIVSLGDGEIAFVNENGIYRTVGGVLQRVADLNTPIPDGVGNFRSFDRSSLISLGNTNLAFVASGQQRDDNGIYALVDGSLERVADESSAVPGGTGHLAGFGPLVSLGSGQLGFRGSAFLPSAQEGIYTNVGGSLRKVADLNTRIPRGNESFLVFNTASLVGVGEYSLAFVAWGEDDEAGIYTDFGGTLRAIADRTDEIPGGVGVFTEFGNPVSLGNGNVAFVGYGPIVGQSGIYTNLGGTIRKMVDINTPVPNGEGYLRTFGVYTYGFLFADFVATGDKVAFVGSNFQDDKGIFIVYADDGQNGTESELPPAIENLTISRLNISIDKRGQSPYDPNEVNFRNIDKLTVKGTFRLDADADPNRDLVGVYVSGVGGNNMCLTCSRPTTRKGGGDKVKWKWKTTLPPLDPRSIYYKTKRGKIKFTLSRKGDSWKFEYKTRGRLSFSPLVNRSSTTLEVHLAFATTSDPYTRFTSKAIAYIPVGIRESNKKITVSYP